MYVEKYVLGPDAFRYSLHERSPEYEAVQPRRGL